MSAGLQADWVQELIAGTAPLLRTRRAGRAMRGLTSVDSTMSEAVRWMSEGAPDGALVVAATQTAGRGRLGRRWMDTPGASLLCSVVLQAQVPAGLMGLVPLAAGVACADAIGDAATRPVALKWPNDVLVDERKIAGILVEAHAGAFIIGVGVNLTDSAIPEGLAWKSTSLAAAGAGAPAQVLAGLLNRLEPLVDGITADAGAAVRGAWESLMVGRRDEVTVSFPGTSRARIRGKALGLAHDGGLRLDTPYGEEIVHSGDVTLSESETPTVQQ